LADADAALTEAVSSELSADLDEAVFGNSAGNKDDSEEEEAVVSDPSG